MAQKIERQPIAIELDPALGVCTLRSAGADDVQTVIELRDDAARWMQARGIEQWEPGEVPASYFEQRVAEGAVWLLRRDDQLLGTVMVSWSDPGIWGSDQGQAGYIHGLVIDQQLAGQGVGRQLLHWAEAHIAGSGRQVARLDCVAVNQRLRRYYEDADYRQVGTKDFPNIEWARKVALYEKALSPQT
jgi:GNAT superfamily N-acetyltransferase